ncbi:ABC transporter permease [Nocardioides insulae]|uniref:ABC transporter permease n=1 Tax=Nocardioides insulae TaxID=394734 RepID=UPI0003F7F4BF|nr:ABC transporter permease [Nocardioides insulae]
MSIAEPALEPDAAPAAQDSSSTSRLDREQWLMLVLPPLLIVAGSIGFLWWRSTAELDSVEANALRWSEIGRQTVEHIELTFVSAAIVVLLAVPLGVLLTRQRFRPLTPFAIGLANAGQAAPSVGLIVLLFLWLNGTGLSGFWISIIALSIYGILPVLRNTITGVEGVDQTLIEAGRGVGMTSFGTLLHIEMRLAVPVIMSGLRTALVLIAGTAALATFVNGGGLGQTLYAGISLFRISLMVSGALLVAMLALFIEWLGRLLELAARPKGL